MTRIINEMKSEPAREQDVSDLRLLCEGVTNVNFLRRPPAGKDNLIRERGQVKLYVVLGESLGNC